MCWLEPDLIHFVGCKISSTVLGGSISKFIPEVGTMVERHGSARRCSQGEYFPAREAGGSSIGHQASEEDLC